MLMRAFRRTFWLAPALLMLSAMLPSQSPAAAAPTQPDTISYWGMNLYLTKRERLSNDDNLGLLADTAQSAGVAWTREELPWDLIEQRNNRFGGVYDAALKQTADKGFGIIGMLLTTPAWARDSDCRPTGPAYWCPPGDVQEYAQFAAWMVERYDGDGVKDALGSPRIAAWELWNEPNDTLLWPDLGDDPNARKRRYGEMLVAAYAAIKAADPTALVLIGGVYIFDGGCAGGVCDGLNFLNGAGGVFQQVPDARYAFDVFSIHPYIPTVRPDDPAIPPVITVEGRISNSRAWLDDGVGRPDAPIWVTEMGWCTAPGTCPAGVQVSEDAQADYLVRSMVIAQQSGVQHTSWFQFEDAFDDDGREWSNAAIVRNFDGSSYPAKPAYHAYRTLALTLGSAAPAGPGPLHQHVHNPRADRGDSGIYDYRYVQGSAVIDVLWRPTSSGAVSFPVEAGKQVTLVDRDGARHTPSLVNGAAHVEVGERPIFIVQSGPPSLQVSPARVEILAELGTAPNAMLVSIANRGGGPLLWTATTNIPWLRLSPSSGAAPGALRVTANTSGMTIGEYSGSMTIATDAGGTITLPVTLRIVSTLHRTYLPFTGR